MLRPKNKDSCNSYEVRVGVFWGIKSVARLGSLEVIFEINGLDSIWKLREFFLTLYLLVYEFSFIEIFCKSLLHQNFYKDNYFKEIYLVCDSYILFSFIVIHIFHLFSLCKWSYRFLGS